MFAVYCGLFLAAGSVLLLEIALTRVLAILMWHHFTYMVVSIALLGFGAAGSILTALRQGGRKERPEGPLTYLALAYGLATLVCLWLVLRVPVDTMALWSKPLHLVWLGLVYVLLTVPFLLAGGAVGLTLSRLAEHVNRLYFVDLMGSAIGGAASIWLLHRFGGAGTALVAGALGILAGAAFSLGADRRARVIAFSATALSLGFLFVAIPRTGLPGGAWGVPFAPGKEFASIDDAARLFSPTAEVEVGESGPLMPFLGGDIGADQRAVTARAVGQDGSAPTQLLQDAVNLESFAFLDDTQAGSAYVSFAARGGEAPEVLVIGVGGGIDVMIALAHGARKITAVEINPAMVEMVTERYDDYLGGLFTTSEAAQSGRLDLLLEEGRSFVRGSDRRFDIIQMSGVDSFTALSTGAYTLSESYLYTTEAVKDFYEHLAEGGYINYSRFILNHPRKPRETLRLANIARQALAELGIADPASQILVFQGRSWASTIIKRGPFTTVEVDALRAFADSHDFWGVVFDPTRRKGEALSPTSRQRASARAAIEYLVERDEQKALLEMGVPQATLAAALEEAYALQMAGDDERAAVALEGPLASVPAAQRDEARVGLEQALARVAFFDRGKGGDFQRKRIDFDRLLRGSDEERAEFVERYEYDLTPTSDDAPFFFNYYRYGGLFGGIGAADRRQGAWDKYHPDFPVGHLVLLVSMGQTVLLGALLILLPLRSLERAGVPAPGRAQVFSYFAALGVGFMLIEIALMQQMVLFLGHPTYAVTVVLCSLLAFAGIGSLAAGRVVEVTPRALSFLAGAILVALLLVSLVVAVALPHLLSLSFAARAVLAVVVLAPLGIVLGMAFPSGIRVVERFSPALVPWAWAINGFLSVLGSALCIILSMSIGFSGVLVLAAVTYALGFAALIRRLRGWTAGEPNVAGAA